MGSPSSVTLGSGCEWLETTVLRPCKLRDTRGAIPGRLDLTRARDVRRSRMSGMYTALVVAHSLLRWVVLGLAVVALVRAVSGWSGGGPWTGGDEQVNRFFVIAFDLQVLIGLILYVGLSPMTQAAFQDFGAAMGNSVLRFWAVEHIFGMLAAVALVHIGRVRARRAVEPAARHRTTAIFFGLALLITLLTIPWPFMPAARPLFPSF